MFRIILISVLLSIVATLSAQHKSIESYRLYNNKGKEIDFSKMIKKMSKADVILFGELHDNPICHWLQFKVTQSLYGRDSVLMLGAEMFETDDQILIDEYITGLIRKKDFEKYANLWPNYKTDYKRLFEFAVAHNLKFVGTNIPRRYASLVYREGYEGLKNLSKTAKSYIAPMPITFDTTEIAYKKMLKMDMGHGAGQGNSNIVKSQAIKDATMAWFISQNMVENVPFLHFQGDFHSADYSAIYYYLKQYQPSVKIITVSTIGVEDLDFKDEYEQKADYLLLIKDDMTSTY